MFLAQILTLTLKIHGASSGPDRHPPSNGGLSVAADLEIFCGRAQWALASGVYCPAVWVFSLFVVSVEWK